MIFYRRFYSLSILLNFFSFFFAPWFFLPLLSTLAIKRFNIFLIIAAQMWCLGKSLPLLIGSFIPEEEDKWQHFLLLLKIVDIVFSPKTSVDSIGLLEGLIEEYLTQFKDLYPGKSVIPKMHYLVHYPSHMYKCVKI